MSSLVQEPQTLDDISDFVDVLRAHARQRKERLFTSERKIMALLNDVQYRLKSWSERHHQYPNYEIIVTALRNPQVLQLELMAGNHRLAMMHTGQSFVFYEDQKEHPELDPSYAGIPLFSNAVVSSGTERKEILRIASSTHPEEYTKWIEHHFGQHILNHQNYREHRILLNVATNLQEQV